MIVGGADTIRQFVSTVLLRQELLETPVEADLRLVTSSRGERWPSEVSARGPTASGVAGHREWTPGRR